jgi:peptidyl-Asp metalloendopeptidase
VRQQCICWAVGIAAGVIAVASPAQAAGLFDPASSGDLRAASQTQSNEGVLRRRLVRLNAAELARIVPADADNAANRGERARTMEPTVTIDLFPGVSVTVDRTEIDTPETGGYAWSGRSTSGAKDAFVTLIISNGEVLAQIQTGGKLYRIEPVSGALHQIVEIDQNKIRDDIHAKPPAGVPHKKSDLVMPPRDPRVTNTTIKIMIAHTVNARKEVGTASQMQARINMAVALANTAFANSGVQIRFARVGGANEIAYADTTVYGGLSQFNNYSGPLYDLAGLVNNSIPNNQTGKFAALRTKRSTVGADLVVLMRKQGVACGIAFEPDINHTGHVMPGDQLYGYSVVTSTPGSGCIEAHTLAHETGHNQGMNHDRVQHQLDYSVPNPPSSQYNFGYVNKTAQFFTIMSYRTSCGIGCTAIPFHSTPKKTYNGKVVGIAQGKANAADGARLLNENRGTVSGFRP